MFGFGVERHRRSTPKVFQDARSGETWVKYLFELYLFNSSVNPARGANSSLKIIASAELVLRNGEFSTPVHALVTI